MTFKILEDELELRNAKNNLSLCYLTLTHTQNRNRNKNKHFLIKNTIKGVLVTPGSCLQTFDSTFQSRKFCNKIAN